MEIAAKKPLKHKLIPIVFPITERISRRYADKIAVKLFFTPGRRPLNKTEQNQLQTAKQHIFKVDDIKFRTFEWGFGPTVLLTHGWGGNCCQFKHFIEPLLLEGYRVITFDAPGHGTSEGNYSSIVKFEKAIQKIAEELGSIDFLIGHSLGGVANLLAKKHGLKAKKAVTISAPSISEDIIYQFRKRINGSEKVGNSIENYIRATYGMDFKDVSGEKLAEELKLQIPFLLIHDKEDKVVPVKHHIALKKKIPNSDHFYTEGFGHTRILSNPEVIENLIAFLKS